MSLDLQKAFGYYKEENPSGPGNQWGDQDAGVRLTEADDFGDFEAPESEIQIPAERSSVQNYPFTSGTAQVQSKTQLGKSVLGQERPDCADLDDDWGDFIDHPEESHTKQFAYEGKARLNNGQSSERVGDASLSITSSNPYANPSEPPQTASLPESDSKKQSSIQSISSVGVTLPTNIPPPSTLLFLAATLLQSLPAEIKTLLAEWKPSPGQPTDIGQATLDQVKLELSFTRAIARIIAGRKLRWKRDTRLSQSMKMGPAQAGKSGGMKLTGIDRMESRREDQEAAEAVRIWKQHVGGLRASVANAKVHHPGSDLAIPEIAEMMPVRAAKGSEGALTAPKCCLLCGLKREERVEKVDVNVEDSFGEWWTEHWGHYECRKFWETHEGSLQQR
ncbi:MAG: hypothetical protein HETSPECPRED_008788 [Heterodermia speciosa]|uniref:Uncharacterized protein n=1 Tax=Heterodermia speciosa TaxID=116794 RepID=A0A8H3I8J7_9LECA|nr:MAG: hypothetical protein HETSPECPRED_008788 [Heterodermia speciosa]